MAGEDPTDPTQMTEEQLRAAYEQEIKRVRVEHVLLENVVTMVNLGMRRTGLMPGTEDERDLDQVHLAIESVRALLPQIDAVAPDQATPIRDALSQLQMAFVQARGEQPAGAAGGGQSGAPRAGGGAGGTGGAGGSGGAGGPAGSGNGPQQPGHDQPGPAQQSGRLWVPGQ